MQAEYFVDELSLIADDGRNDFMRRVREHGEEFVAVDREAPGALKDKDRQR
jgi:hypothetical protein